MLCFTLCRHLRLLLSLLHGCISGLLLRIFERQGTYEGSNRFLYHLPLLDLMSYWEESFIFEPLQWRTDIKKGFMQGWGPFEGFLANWFDLLGQAQVDKFQSFDHSYVRLPIPEKPSVDLSSLLLVALKWLVEMALRLWGVCSFNLGISLKYGTGLGSVVVLAATLFALWSGVTDGSTAVVIFQAGRFADATRALIKVAAQLELDFNSVERVTEYLDVPQEAPAVIEKFRAPAYWPSSSGNLIVENLVIQYAPHLPPALYGLSFTVNPSEKIGVVSGTSSYLVIQNLTWFTGWKNGFWYWHATWLSGRC